MKIPTSDSSPRLAVWLAGLPSVIIAAGVLLAAGASHAAPYKAPRTAYGAPDLQGLWTNTALTFLQRPPIFKGLIATDKEEAMMVSMFKKMAGDIISPDPVDPKLPAPPVVKDAPQSDYIEMELRLARINGQPRTSWIVEPADGKLPFTEAEKKMRAAAAKAPEVFDNPEDRDTQERCLTAIGSPEGPPMMNTGFNGNYQILQTRDYVTIEVEMNHDVRIIRMDDRSHQPAAIQPWLGDSVGWWDGDTLVVETTNLNPKGHVYSLGGGFRYSPQTRITERFTRTAKDQILYEFSVEDPEVFTKAWRAEMPMRTAKGPIYEYACHEGNYSLPNILAGARVEEQAPKPPATPAAPAK
ncbi:hypothetical protein [Phenylobacterium sp.]|uniref:hypothetical protein n=1 Tax=Phenylobacterium sp. TaxID=1871053 RepID=UPI00356185FF